VLRTCFLLPPSKKFPYLHFGIFANTVPEVFFTNNVCMGVYNRLYRTMGSQPIENPLSDNKLDMSTGYVKATVWGFVTEYPMPYSNADPSYPDKLRMKLERTNFPPAPRCRSRTCLIHLAADSKTYKLVIDYLLTLSTRMIGMWSKLSDVGQLRKQDFNTALAGYSAQLARRSDPWSTLHMLLSFMRVTPLVCDLVLAGCCRADDLPFLAILRMFSYHMIINTKIRSVSARTAVYVRRTTMADYVRIYDTDAATTVHTLPGPLMLCYILTTGSTVEYDIHKPPFPATEAHITPPTSIEMSTLSPIERDAAAPPHRVEHSIRRAAVVVSV